ncbi:MAG: hypothetical protein KDE59_19695, partial [Anaerolineales bacterium]|nr:hypothetical protein [Anaerolineales bacterium]
MKAKLLKPNLIALYLVLTFLGLTWLRFQRSEGQTNAFVSVYYSLSFDYPASWYAAEFPPGSPPPKSNKLYQIELRSGDGLVDSQAVVVRIYVRSHGGESLAEIVRQDPAGLEYQPSHLLSTQEAVIGQGDY